MPVPRSRTERPSRSRPLGIVTPWSVKATSAASAARVEPRLLSLRACTASVPEASARDIRRRTRARPPSLRRASPPRPTREPVRARAPPAWRPLDQAPPRAPARERRHRAGERSWRSCRCSDRRRRGPDHGHARRRRPPPGSARSPALRRGRESGAEEADLVAVPRTTLAVENRGQREEAEMSSGGKAREPDGECEQGDERHRWCLIVRPRTLRSEELTGAALDASGSGRAAGTLIPQIGRHREFHLPRDRRSDPAARSR